MQNKWSLKYTRIDYYNEFWIVDIDIEIQNT